MARARGENTRLIIAIESSYNTIAGSLGANKKAIVLPYVSETIQEAQTMIESKTIKTTRNANKPGRGNLNVAGDVKFELNPLMYAILSHALGSRSTIDSYSSPNAISENAAAVVNETPPYITTYKIGDLPVSFTLEKKFAGLTTPKYFQYTGCRVNKFDMAITAEGLIDCAIALIGSKLTIASDSISKNGGDENGWDLDYVHKPLESFELLAANLKVSGTAVAYISKMSFSIENNLDGSAYIVGGLGQRTSLPEGVVKVVGTMEALFGDDSGADAVALVNSIIAGTPSSIDLTFTRGTGDGSAGNEFLRILMAELIFTRGSPVVSGPKGVMVALPFTAYYATDSNATTVLMTLKQSNPPRI